MVNGKIFKDAVISGSNNISNSRVSVDELNIFPVPDGDTGTNMSLTIGNAAKELNVNNDMSVANVSKVTAGALLRGARGNSGVILSLIFRGLSKGFKDCEEADGEQLVAALKSAVKSAYGAVMKPTEGTILTVIREASEAADKAFADGTTDFDSSVSPTQKVVFTEKGEIKGFTEYIPSEFNATEKGEKVNGSFTYNGGTEFLTITLGDVEYEGVLCEMTGESGKRYIALSAVGSDNSTLLGIKEF